MFSRGELGDNVKNFVLVLTNYALCLYHMVCLTDIDRLDAEDYVGRGEKAPALIAQEPFCPSGLTVYSNSKVYYNGGVKTPQYGVFPVSRYAVPVLERWSS